MKDSDKQKELSSDSITYYTMDASSTCTYYRHAYETW